ncbi:MAG: CoA transferase [Myxococcota bacterium]
MSDALSGVRVIDLADRSAALAGRILADLGAEVILVEPPEGQPIRRLAPFLDDEAGPERGFQHLYFNASKHSVVLEDDLASSPTFERLVASADVLIDTARPGTRAGLEHARLRALCPDLIQISVTPFGLADETGRKANDLVAGATGGLVAISGERRGTPVQGGASPSYTLAGLTAASAATVALTKGQGTHVDLSLQEATLSALMQTSNATQWTWFDRVPSRPGLSAALECRDGGHVGLLLRPDRFPEYLRWLDRVGIPHEMTEDDWPWSRLDAPRKGNPVAEGTLGLARALTRDEFAAGALEADIVCLPVLGFEDLEGVEQYRVNEQFLEVEHEALGRRLGFVRSTVDGMADGVTIRRAPLLGEHTKTILDALPAPPARPSVSVDATSPDPARQLEGLRVVDFGWVLAAPIGTRLLASYGAEVIRIENRRKPDSMRSQLGPDGQPDPDLGGLYNTVNAGKKSLCLDLGTPGGIDLLLDLVRTSDVVVNNFRPGALERMGLGYDVLRTARPDIVLLNMPGAHKKGPWSGRASMGNILMAASGFNMLTGFEGEQPRGIGIPLPDFVAPHLLTATILSAIRKRDRGGGGQEIDLAQLSATVALLGAEWMQYRATGTAPPRNGNRDANACPHGVYPAAGEDDWLALAVQSEAEWIAFTNAIGDPGLAEDPRFATHAARKLHEDALDERVRAWTRRQDKWRGAEHLQAAGVAAGPVEHLRDTFERDPLLRAHYQIVHQPVAPDVAIPIDRESARYVGREHVLTRAPGLGEHNEHVVREVLGRSDEDFIELVVSGVLQ